MGMFDYVKVDRALPKSDWIPLMGNTAQAKDLACDMGTYEVSAAGYLRCACEIVPYTGHVWLFFDQRHQVRLTFIEGRLWRSLWGDEDVNHGFVEVKGVPNA